MAGRLNRTSARELPEPDLEVTFRSESVPKLLPAALWITQLSLSAATVAVVQAATTVQARAAGDWSTLPAASIARTWTWWLPTANPVYWCGEAQPLHAPPSREHWNDEPASLDENSNVAVVAEVEPVGPLSMVVSGAVVSGTIVHVRFAADWSTLPLASTALTRNSCSPSARLKYDLGEAQAPNAPPSSEHSKLEPVSLEENVNAALGSVVEPCGPASSVVSGAVKSGEPKVSTSCGRLLPCSRLLNACSASWFSLASRIRKPRLVPVYW